MRTLLNQVRSFLQADFRWSIYLYTIILLGLSTWANYAYGFNTWLNRLAWGSPMSYLVWTLFFASIYLAVLMPKLWLEKEPVWKTTDFWIRSLFFLFLLGLNSGFYLHFSLLTFFPSNEQAYWTSILNEAYGLLITLPLLLAFAMIHRIKGSIRYGLQGGQNHLRPYLWMMLAMLPLLYLASLRPSFYTFYPTCRSWWYQPSAYLGPTGSMVFYEAWYGLDFIRVELLFRGMLVVGMVQTLGRHAVLPMAAAYVFLHFGKPPGEAVSSFFGGYILGAFALRSQSIWGGCLVHIFIAWMMDFLAWMQN